MRVFSGGQQPRPDLMKRLVDDCGKPQPGVSMEKETCGATSELQRLYLSTVLDPHDPRHQQVPHRHRQPGPVLWRRLTGAFHRLGG